MSVKQMNPASFLIVLFFLLAVGTQSFFVVNQTQKALVLQLGDPKDEVYSPGLHFKLPFIQTVEYFDARFLDYDARSREAFTVDKKAIVLDNYARWRIVDPLQFYRTMRTEGGAQQRLDDVVYSELRALVGAYTLTEVVSSQRAQIMEEVTRKVDERMRTFGVEVADVRIKRTDLPEENQKAIFERMRAERERQAKQYRSEGEEESTRIRSDADRQKAVLLAEAAKKSEIIRGEADAVAAATYAKAFGKSPEFYDFKRNLDALRKSMQENSRIVLSQGDPFLKSLH